MFKLKSKYSPLLHGQNTGKMGDLATQRLYLIAPLSKKQINWLNTIIIATKLIHINYWSITHFNYGIFFGILFHYFSHYFNLSTLLISHTIFEIWELWAFGYFTDLPLDLAELFDTIFDTIFTIIGYFFGKYFFWFGTIFFIAFHIILFMQ